MTSAPISHRPPRSWLKVTVQTPLALAEAVAAFVAALSEGGAEHGYTPVGQETAFETITGYLANDKTLAAKESFLKKHLADLNQEHGLRNQLCLSTEFIEEQDWNATWKRQFTAFRITPHLVVKPSWEEYIRQGNEAVIEMDPGMAFGTGQHASTALALLLLESLFREKATLPLSVLDVGTGTGILAMACALWGAQQGVAIDNDPDAVFIARENISQNRLTDSIEVSGTALSSFTKPFNAVVANITHDALQTLAPELTRLVATGGSLVLAGVLQGQQEKNIRLTIEMLGLETTEIRRQGEWAALLFKKR